LNLEDIQLYLNFLSSSPSQQTTVCGAWFDRKGKSVISGYGTWYGNYEEIIQQYKLLREIGYKDPNFHVSLNEMDDKGRGIKNVESCRVFCVDIDTPWKRKKIREYVAIMAPHVVVRSSRDGRDGSKYHCYWKVTSELDLSTWAKFQAGLLSGFGFGNVPIGDENLTQLNHTIRVPGFPRITKNGVRGVPKIVWIAGDAKEIGSDDLANQHWQKILKKGEQVLKQIKARRPGGAAAGGAGGEIQRNKYLYDQCHDFAYTGNGDITDASVLEFAMGINSQFPQGGLDDGEVRKTAHSAFIRGVEARERSEALANKKQKKAISRITQLLAIEKKFNYSLSGKEFELAKYSDSAVAMRVLLAFPNCTVAVEEDLYSFKNSLWAGGRRGVSIVHGYVRDVIGDMVLEQAYINEYGKDSKGKFSSERYQEAVNKRLSASSIEACSRLYLKSDTHRKMKFEDFDKKSFGFYCANGYLDLRTGELRDAKATDYLLHQSNIKWMPSAVCPYWDKLLLEVVETREMWLFIQELYGYTLSGSISEQKLFLHFGLTCNGKSTILKVLGNLCGGYMAMLGSDALTRKKGGWTQEIKRIGYKVGGNRCMIIDDLETHTEWNESLVKSLTGGRIVAAGMRENEIDIPNKSKFHLGCNSPPAFGSLSRAMQRRMCLITYNVEFAVDSAKENEIETAVELEMEGILVWAVEGYRRMFERGRLEYPEDVLLATDEYTVQDGKANRVESTLRSLFKIPKTDQEKRENWYPISELTDIAQTSLNADFTGFSHQSDSISPIVLGRLFGKWGFTRRRKYKNNLVEYNVVLK